MSNCPRCGKELSYIQQTGLWYCFTCQQYFQLVQAPQPSQGYQQPIQQPIQQAQPYPPQYQQTYQQAPLRKGKSKLPIVAGVIVIIAILLIAALFLFLNPLNEEGKTLKMTMAEFIDDYEDVNSDGSPDNLKSFNEGDKVRIFDNVAYIEYDDDNDITVIFCESTMEYDWGFPIILDGDQTDDYDVGDTITVTWHIRRYVIEGSVVEFPEELYWYFTSGYLISSTETTPVISMNWNEDYEHPGIYIGYVVSISGVSSINTYDVTLVVTHGGSSGSIDLDVLAGVATLNVGDLTLDFTDHNPIGTMAAEDVFNISGGESGDIVRLVYKPTSGQMCSTILQ